eukprot:359738_1
MNRNQKKRKSRYINSKPKKKSKTDTDPPHDSEIRFLSLCYPYLSSRSLNQRYVEHFGRNTKELFPFCRRKPTRLLTHFSNIGLYINKPPGDKDNIYPSKLFHTGIVNELLQFPIVTIVEQIIIRENEFVSLLEAIDCIND